VRQCRPREQECICLPRYTGGVLVTGKFPDETVLVKEQFEAETANMTSGVSSHAQTMLG